MGESIIYYLLFIIYYRGKIVGGICICIENLDMKAMAQNLSFGKSVSDNGWGMFVTFLQYKIEELEKKFVKVDKFFASSQTCSVCGYKNIATKNLSTREWNCPKCGTHHDRWLQVKISFFAKTP